MPPRTDPTKPTNTHTTAPHRSRISSEPKMRLGRRFALRATTGMPFRFRFLPWGMAGAHTMAMTSEGLGGAVAALDAQADALCDALDMYTHASMLCVCARAGGRGRVHHAYPSCLRSGFCVRAWRACMYMNAYECVLLLFPLLQGHQRGQGQRCVSDECLVRACHVGQPRLLCRLCVSMCACAACPCACVFLCVCVCMWVCACGSTHV